MSTRLPELRGVTDSGSNPVSEGLGRTREIMSTMTQATFARPAGPAGPALSIPDDVARYRPGVCNIGPEEIARRRRAGHGGSLATIVMLALLIAIHAPPLARLLLILPAAVAASGYLQAWLKFCAAFGAAGSFNFGPLGAMNEVGDDEARARDRIRALQIGLASLGVGLAVGLAAVTLPA